MNRQITPAVVANNRQLFDDTRPFGILIIASSCMSYIPGGNIGTFIFGLYLVIFMCFSLVKGKVHISDGRSVLIVVFIIWSSLSFFTLSSNGYGFDEWSRGIVPFLFFALYLFIVKLGVESRRVLAKYLFYACVIWAIRIVGEAMILASQGSDVLTVRLTYRVNDAVLPYPFIAITYLLFCGGDMKPIIRWTLIFIFTYLLFWIGYRAGIVLATIPMMVFILDNFARRNVWPVGLLVVLLIALYSSGIFSSFGLLERFSGLGAETDGSKVAEWRYAIDHFLSSPLLGMGIGWQVPGDIAYIGVDTTGIIIPDRVGYVHSAFAYMAMNLGIVGIVLYYSIVRPTMIWPSDDALKKFSSISLLVLLLFCLTQASFRTIQTIIMVIALVKINTFRRSTVL